MTVAVACALCGRLVERRGASVSVLLEGWPPRVRRASWHAACASRDPLRDRVRAACTDHQLSLCLDEVEARGPDRVVAVDVPLPAPTPVGERLRDDADWRRRAAPFLTMLRERPRRWSELEVHARRLGMLGDQLTNVMAWLSIKELAGYDARRETWYAAPEGRG